MDKSRSSTPDYYDSDSDEHGAVIVDEFAFHHQQKLSHLNKSRPKRSNVTKPTNHRVPQINSISNENLYDTCTKSNNSLNQLKPLDVDADLCNAMSMGNLDFSPKVKVNIKSDQPILR